MDAAFKWIFKNGYQRASLVGTDVADLMSFDILEAFQGLDVYGGVVGPARDGGFYLIGLKSAFEKAFNFQIWSVPSVFDRTLKCFHDSGIPVKTLTRRKDIDRQEDLPYLEKQPGFQDRISIIIPFLRETKPLDTLVDSLEAQVWPDDEIILVRGTESTKGVREVITPRTRLVFAPRGRGAQLNRGAGEARGNLFWFLHADTIPSPNFGYHIRKLSGASGMALGCFELKFMQGPALLRFIAGWANFRTKTFKLPYGDQGLFCRRQIFDKVGGFRKQYLMEDVEFVRNCRKLGKLLVIGQPIVSSPKRYLAKGILRSSFQNHLLMLLYFFGVSDKRLYSFYYDRV
jgi:rSAM/selenodomain-associated transferase 2